MVLDHCPAVVAPWLVRKIGAGKARALLLSGGTRSGQEALELGLLTHLVAKEQLDESAQKIAQDLSEGRGIAMQATKRWLNDLDGSIDPDLHERAAQLSADVIARKETQERLRSIFKV